MKPLLKFILVITIATLSVGLYMLNNDFDKGNFVVGISVLLFAFVLLPIFLYHRYKGKNLKDYTLNKEKIDKLFNQLNS